MEKTVTEMLLEVQRNNSRNQNLLEKALTEVRERQKPYSPPKSMETPVTDLSSGMRAVQAKTYLKLTKYVDQQKRANQIGAHPDIKEFTRRFVKRMATKYYVPLFAHNMVRTHEEQEKLFADRVSKARAGESPHNYGCAVDIVHSVVAWGLTRESWTMLGHIGKELASQMGIKIIWGGDWSFYDPAHWELDDWRKHSGGFPFEGG